MIRTLFASAVLAAMVGPAFSQQHEVSQDALTAVGLPGMKQVTDDRGDDVRGKFSITFGKSSAFTHVSGAIHDPHTGSYMSFGGAYFDSRKSITIDKGSSDPKLNVTFAAAPSLGYAALEVPDDMGNPVVVGRAHWGIIGIGAGGSFSWP